MAPLPIHPVVNAFPIVATVLAALAMIWAGLLAPSRRPEWLGRSLLLLGVALAALPAVAWSGRIWAAAMGIWPPGRALPPRAALGGLLALHALGATASAALTLSGFLLLLRHRRGRGPFWAALLVVAAAALATGVTAHLGGRMAFGPPEVPADS